MKAGLLPHFDDPLVELTEEIQVNPNFSIAILKYSETILGWRQGSRLINKLVGSYARSAIVGFLLYLHWDADRNDPDSGPTYLKLLELCERDELCSSRVLTTVLTLLRVAGFVSVARGANDRRLKIFRPTTKLINHVVIWYEQVFGVLDLLFPDLDALYRLRQDPRFFERFILSISRPYFADGIAVGEYYPNVYEIFRRDSGFPTVISILEAVVKGRPVPSIQMIAERFGSSKSQVRAIVRIAAEREMLTFSPSGQILECKVLVAELQAFIAREMAFYITYSEDFQLALLTETGERATTDVVSRTSSLRSNDPPSSDHRPQGH